MSYKQELTNKVDNLIEKLTEEELDDVLLHIKELLKLPRTTKLLSDEVDLYLIPYVSLIDEDGEVIFNNKFITDLNSKYKRILKEYVESNNNIIISSLLNLDNNFLQINNDDEYSHLKINSVGKIKGDYFIIHLNKIQLNEIEIKLYEEQYNNINNKINKFYDIEEQHLKLDIYEELYYEINNILEDNYLKIPRELRKLESREDKIEQAIEKMKECNKQSFDIRFKRYELYSIKDILDEKGNNIIKFNYDNDTYELDFVLKKIS